jgi:uncharacterized cofD-like protein
MQKNKRIVVIGGGTGTYTVLKGLKFLPNVDLTAIVSSMDSGGSNKKFRDEFGLLPPSDFRQCLIALADEDKTAVNPALRDLMMYRFEQGQGLEGQTFGNILIAALTDIYGSQIKAFEKAGEILKIKGKVLPITIENVHLLAEYENGEIVFGEHLIDEPEPAHDGTKRIKRLFLSKKASIYERAKSAILSADIIILGPGDLYTSTIANLIVEGAGYAIRKSHAKFIYFCNLFSKYGQTKGFKASDHVKEIEHYAERKVDFVVVNNGKISDEAIRKYKVKGDHPIKDDLGTSKKGEATVIRKNLLASGFFKKSSADVLFRSLVRHDSKKIADVVEGLL